MKSEEDGRVWVQCVYDGSRSGAIFRFSLQIFFKKGKKNAAVFFLQVGLRWDGFKFLGPFFPLQPPPLSYTSMSVQCLALGIWFTKYRVLCLCVYVVFSHP